jgi:hypothetical protein
VSYSPALYRDVSTGPNQIRLAGSFQCNGALAIDQTTIRGKGIKSVTRAGIGIFTVVFNGSYLSRIAGAYSVAGAGTTGISVNLTGDLITDPVAPSFTFTVYATGSGTIDLSSSARIEFDLVLSTDASNK